MSITKHKPKAASQIISQALQGQQGQNSKKEQVEERRNEIKRKLFEQMQSDVSKLTNEQNTSQEKLENAKKLKNVIVNQLYQQNRDLQQVQVDKYLKIVQAEQQGKQGIKVRSRSAQKDSANVVHSGGDGGGGNAVQRSQKQYHECVHKVGCPKNHKINNMSLPNGLIQSQLNGILHRDDSGAIENDPPSSPVQRKKKSQSSESHSASSSGQKRLMQNLIQSEEDKLEIMRKIEDQKKEIAQQSNKKYENIKNTSNLNHTKPPRSNNEKPTLFSSSDKQVASFVEMGAQQNGKIKENSHRPRSSSSIQQINRNEQNAQRHKSQIFDLQYMLERQSIENTQKMRGIEVKTLNEQLEKDSQFEKQVLDIKQQQKQILLLVQEKEMNLEHNDRLQKKCEQLQRELKISDRNKENVENKLHDSAAIVKDLQGQLAQSQIEIQNLNKKQTLLIKMNQEAETAQNKLLVQKQTSDQQISEKLSQYEGLNRQNIDLSIEFERKNKESQYQIASLLDRINELTQKSQSQAKNLGVLEKKYKTELSLKEQLSIDLKMIQAQVSENETLRKKLKIKEDKIEELDGVIDHLKRTIRGNPALDMKNNHNTIERIIEKPVFIEKIVEIHRSQNQQQSQDIIASELEKTRDECNYWKSRCQQIEERCDELSRRNQDIISSKDQQIVVLDCKIESLLSEIELLTRSNIDKNRKIANSLINIHSNEFKQLTHHLPSNYPHNLSSSQGDNNNNSNPPFFTSSNSAYVPYSQLLQQ